MKAVLIRHLNDIVSVTLLALMAMALAAGQVNAATHAPPSNPVHSIEVVLEVRAQK